MGSEAVERTRVKVERYLNEKGWPYEKLQSGNYKLYQGSTFVVIGVKQWGENTLVTFRAPVALEITNLSPRLTRMLMEKNYELILGKFSLNKHEPAIYYENAILGNDLDPEELYNATEAAATVADKYDDDIARYSGGKRAID